LRGGYFIHARQFDRSLVFLLQLGQRGIELKIAGAFPLQADSPRLTRLGEKPTLTRL
jgi:hypothetical protein